MLPYLGKDFANVIKYFERERYPGLCGWALNANTRVLIRGR